MSFSIHKILNSGPDKNFTDDKQVATFVLMDDSTGEKRKITFGGLPNDDSQARNVILGNADWLYSKGDDYPETPSKIAVDSKEAKVSEDLLGKVLDIAQEGKPGPKKTIPQLKSEISGTIDPIEIGGK